MRRRADAILGEAVGLPVLTGASAMLVIELEIDERLSQTWPYGEEFAELIDAARNYLASIAVARA